MRNTSSLQESNTLHLMHLNLNHSSDTQLSMTQTLLSELVRDAQKLNTGRSTCSKDNIQKAAATSKMISNVSRNRPMTALPTVSINEQYHDCHQGGIAAIKKMFMLPHAIEPTIQKPPRAPVIVSKPTPRKKSAALHRQNTASTIPTTMTIPIQEKEIDSASQADTTFSITPWIEPDLVSPTVTKAKPSTAPVLSTKALPMTKIKLIPKSYLRPKRPMSSPARINISTGDVPLFVSAKPKSRPSSCAVRPKPVIKPLGKIIDIIPEQFGMPVIIPQMHKMTIFRKPVVLIDDYAI